MVAFRVVGFSVPWLMYAQCELSVVLSLLHVQVQKQQNLQFEGFVLFGFRLFACFRFVTFFSFLFIFFIFFRECW